MATHKELKEALISQAEQMGLKESDLHVLSTDPFFVGTPDDYEDGKWAADLWDRMMARRRKPLHLRGFHYWIQSQGIKKPYSSLLRKERKEGKAPDKYAYVDPAKDWSWLLKAAQVARYLHIGEWKNLIDLKHPNPADYDNYWVGSGVAHDGQVDIQTELNSKLEGLVDEFIRGLVREAPRYHDDGYQIYHLEVMCEKNSMGFVIEPACRRFGACYQAFVGQASIEKVDLMAERAVRAAQAGKKVRLFYIADWDRYGWSMVSAVARKIEFMTLGQEGIDVKLTRLALNDDHIATFNLPKAPKHGEAVVELDALEAIHPGALGQIVEDALRPYFDTDKPRVVQEENLRIRNEVRRLLEERIQPALQQAFAGIDLEGIAGSVRLDEAINPDFEPPEPGHEVEDNGLRNWVYDSSRDFWTQLEEYRKYKGEREEEAV